TFPAPAASMSATSTDAPSAANDRAIASPKPDAAPVTITRLPSNRLIAGTVVPCSAFAGSRRHSRPLGAVRHSQHQFVFAQTQVHERSAQLVPSRRPTARESERDMAD